jgi:hypothetical protein
MALEDRCLLSTASKLSTAAPLATKGANAKTSAAILRSVNGSAVSLASGQEFVFVMRFSETDGAASYGANSMPNFPLLSPSTPSQPVTSLAQPASPLGAIVVVASPNTMYSAPAGQSSTASDLSRALTWWSQTSHPSSGLVFVLSTPNGASSSLPAAQASTPVVLFLPLQSRSTLEADSPRTISAFFIPAFIKQMVALEIIPTSEDREDVDQGLTARHILAPPNSGTNLPIEERFVEDSRIPRGPTGTKPVPSRAELLALTDKILEDYSAKPEPAWEFSDLLSIRTMVAGATAPAVWFALRHLANKRARKSSNDKQEREASIGAQPQ